MDNVCSAAREVRIDEVDLPFDDVYDVEALNAYYGKRRGSLVARLVTITGCVLKVGRAWLMDEYFPKPEGKYTLFPR